MQPVVERTQKAIAEARRITKRRAYKAAKYKGIPLRIDRPKGHVQNGTGADGKAWTRTYKWDYGFIANTQGGDGDGLDVFVGPHPDQPLVHWVVQTKADGTFDEYKCMLGFTGRKSAQKAYTDHVPVQFYGGMVTTTCSMLKAALGIDPEEQVPHPLAKSATAVDDWAKVRGLLVSKAAGERGFAEAMRLLAKQAPVDMLELDLERWDAAQTQLLVAGAPPGLIAAEREMMARYALRKTEPNGRTSVAQALLDGLDARPIEPHAVSKSVAITKLDQAKRLIYGVVLEPDTVDAQGDTYDADTIEETAHLYLSDFRNVSRQHKQLINQAVKVVQSYIAPVDFRMGEQNVKAGTWILVVKVLDDQLWSDVLAGEVTGYSIEGVASVEQLGTAAPYARPPV